MNIDDDWISNEIDSIKCLYEEAKNGISVQSVFYTGLDYFTGNCLFSYLDRDINQRSMLSWVLCLENKKDFIYYLTQSLWVGCRDKIGKLDSECFDAIKSLVLSFDKVTYPTTPELSERDSLYLSSDLTQCLTDLLESFGRFAKKENEPFVLMIQDFQNMGKQNMDALIAALNRCYQLGYPVMVVATGSEEILSTLENEQSILIRKHE